VFIEYVAVVVVVVVAAAAAVFFLVGVVAVATLIGLVVDVAVACADGVVAMSGSWLKRGRWIGLSLGVETGHHVWLMNAIQSKMRVSMTLISLQVRSAGAPVGGGQRRVRGDSEGVDQAGHGGVDARCAGG
jgi:hypothetical protein